MVPNKQKVLVNYPVAMLFLFPDSTGKNIQTKDKNVAQCPIHLCIHQDKDSARHMANA